MKKNIIKNQFTEEFVDYIERYHPHMLDTEDGIDGINSRLESAQSTYDSSLGEYVPNYQYAKDVAREQLYTGLHFSFHALIMEALEDERLSEYVKNADIKKLAKKIYNDGFDSVRENYNINDDFDASPEYDVLLENTVNDLKFKFL